jgi:hypothetical protein
MSELIDRSRGTHAALRRDPEPYWDDEHVLDNNQAAVTIGHLLDEVHRLQFIVDSFMTHNAEMSYRGRLVPITSEGMRAVMDDNARLELAAHCPTTRLLNDICSCWRHGPDPRPGDTG